ncbi:Rv3235 family protein [uncultured Cellulomonas sp.]|uniref:Rv3235 family protein n=1 Tax=uncultured Cellulomonas sp. TaxID=189682 RepID=UPI00260C0F37|nr:Rv3235 family protein [uncultured Cellulomonas sp.]
MSAAAPAPMPAPGDDASIPWRRGAVGHRLALHLAGHGAPVPAADAARPPEPPQTPQTPQTPERGTTPRARLAPRTEPPADPLPARAPVPGPPPVLGSPEARARHRLPVDTPRDGTPTTGPGVSPDAPLPDPTQLCCAMVQAAVEGLRGARPLVQLVRWVSPEVYEELALRAELVLHAGAPTTTGRAGIRRIRVCRIGARAAEATVVVDDGARVRAVAVRLEAHRGRWRATALEIG